MLLKNIMRHRVDSAVVGMPKLDNYFDEKKPKKAKAMKVKKGPYGGVGYYHPVGLNANSNAETSGGDGGGGGGGE